MSRPYDEHSADRPASRPSARQSFLFFTLLILALLTQIIVLRWGAETVFYVTWLLLALVVQHDGRISACVGLAFLATCPFLLIGKKEAVAERAADYAYIFLAIGVLVQMEEILLERQGWLGRKLDLSYLWRPASRALRRYWASAVQALGRQLTAASRTQLVRLVQIVGTTVLAGVFLWAALGGLRTAVVLPLLGGALLFPFLVWGLRLVVRALGPARLLRVALALVVLSLATAEMVWVHDLVGADRLAHMRLATDFAEDLPKAERTSPAPEGEAVAERIWTIGTVSHRVLYQHPSFAGVSRIAYNVHVGHGAVLAFDLALAPESWLLPGDGVAYAVYVESEQGVEQVFAAYIDPKNNDADQRWHPYTVALGAYAGQTVTLVFETSTGPAGDYRYDWAGWGEPRLLEP